MIYKIFSVCSRAFPLVALLVAGWLKSSWRFSTGLKELHAKHMTTFACIQLFHVFLDPRNFTHSQSDVLLATPGRSGTMFAVHILHQLRTGGDGWYGPIESVAHHVVPLFAKDSSSYYIAQYGEPPRLFFSHGLPEQVQIPRKVIYIQRNPRSLVTSWHNFVTQFYVLKNKLDIEEFYFYCLRRHCFYPDHALFHSVASWWRLQATNDILWITFEELTRSVESSIQTAGKFARFLNDTKMLHASQNYDRLHFYLKKKYIEKNFPRFGTLDLQGRAATVNDACTNIEDYKMSPHIKGVKSLGAHSVTLPDSVTQHLTRSWQLFVAPTTGFKDYAEMEKQLSSE